MEEIFEFFNQGWIGSLIGVIGIILGVIGIFSYRISKSGTFGDRPRFFRFCLITQAKPWSVPYDPFARLLA